MDVSLDAITGAVTGWPLVAVVLSYAVCPYAVLWLAVRLWPKDDDRRRQYLADYEDVEVWMRPLWVGDVATRCVLDGLAARVRVTMRTAGGWRRAMDGVVMALAIGVVTFIAMLLIGGWRAAMVTSVTVIVSMVLSMLIERSLEHRERR